MQAIRNIGHCCAADVVWVIEENFLNLVGQRFFVSNDVANTFLIYLILIKDDSRRQRCLAHFIKRVAIAGEIFHRSDPVDGDFSLTISPSSFVVILHYSHKKLNIHTRMSNHDKVADIDRVCELEPVLQALK